MVGDILYLSAGKDIPADCIMFQANDLYTNEVDMTGEPEPRLKMPINEDTKNDSPCPFVLKGTLMEKGEGKGVVCAVGMYSAFGRTEQMLMGEQGNTPLQDKLETIANQIGMVGVVTAILTFVALMIRGIIKMTADDLPFFSVETLNAVINAFILGVTIIVVAVPEGLPLAVTISLAYSVGEMFKEKNLVRRLHSSETMGGANEICTDKTGTLTQNKMTVMRVYTRGEDKEAKSTDQVQDLLQECFLFNCDAFVEKD